MVETFRLSRQQESVGRLIGYFLGHTGFLTDFSDGSIIRSLSEALAKELYNDNVSYAEGIAESIVTSIKKSFNFPLQQATKAYGEYTFYRKMLPSPIELNADAPLVNAGLTFIANGGSGLGILPSNREYYYGVSGFVVSTGTAASRESAATASSRIMTVPATSAPTALLRWQSQDGYSGYRIYRASIDPDLISTNITGHVDFSTVGSGASLVAKTPSVLPAINGYTGEYFFSVVAFEENPAVSASALRSVGSTPVSIKVGKSSTQCVELYFGGITSANFYKIYRSKIGRPFDIHLKTIDRFLNQNLSLSTHHYSVVASALVGTELYSSPPTSVVSLTVSSATQKTIQMKWLQITDATSYTIYRSASDTFDTSDKTFSLTISAPETPIVSAASTVPLSGSGLDKEKTYFYACSAIVNSSEAHEAESAISTVVEQPITTLTDRSLSFSINRSGSASRYRVYRWEKTTTNDFVAFQEGAGMLVNLTAVITTQANISAFGLITSNITSPYLISSTYSSVWFIQQPYLSSGLTYYNRTAMVKIQRTANSTYVPTLLDAGANYHVPAQGLRLDITASGNALVSASVSAGYEGSTYVPGDIVHVNTLAQAGKVQVTSIFIEKLGASAALAKAFTVTQPVGNATVYLVTVEGLTLPTASAWSVGNPVKFTTSGGQSITSAFVSSIQQSPDSTWTLVFQTSESVIATNNTISTISVGSASGIGPAFTVQVHAAGSGYTNGTTNNVPTLHYLELSKIGGTTGSSDTGSVIYDLRVNDPRIFHAHDSITSSYGKGTGSIFGDAQSAFIMSTTGTFSGSATNAAIMEAPVRTDTAETKARVDFTVGTSGAIVAATVMNPGNGSCAIGDILTVDFEEEISSDKTAAELRVESVSGSGITSVSVVDGKAGTLYSRTAYSGINTTLANPIFSEGSVTAPVNTKNFVYSAGTGATVFPRKYKITFVDSSQRESYPVSIDASIEKTGKISWTTPANANIVSAHIYRSTDSWANARKILTLGTTITATRTLSVAISGTVNGVSAAVRAPVVSGFIAGDLTRVQVGDVVTVTYPSSGLIAALGANATVSAIGVSGQAPSTATQITLTTDTDTINGSLSSMTFPIKHFFVTASTDNEANYTNDDIFSYDQGQSATYSSEITALGTAGLPPRYRSVTSLAKILKVRSSKDATEGSVYNVRPIDYVIPKNNLKYLRKSRNIVNGTVHQASFTGYIGSGINPSGSLIVTSVSSGEIKPGHMITNGQYSNQIFILAQSTKSIYYSSASGIISNINANNLTYDVTVPSVDNLYVNASGVTTFTAVPNPAICPPGIVIAVNATTKVLTISYSPTGSAPTNGNIATISCTYTANDWGGMGAYNISSAVLVTPSTFATNTILTVSTYSNLFDLPKQGDLIFHSQSKRLMSLASEKQVMSGLAADTYIVTRVGSTENLSDPNVSIYTVDPAVCYSIDQFSADTIQFLDNNSLYWEPVDSTEPYVLQSKPVIIFRDNNSVASSGSLWPTLAFPMQHALESPVISPDAENNVLTQFYQSQASNNIWPYLQRLDTIDKKNLESYLYGNYTYFRYSDDGRQAISDSLNYVPISTWPSTSNAQAIYGSIVIPSGTLVGISNTTKRYRTTETLIMSAEQNIISGRVQSILEGDVGNAGANTVTDLITNTYGIEKGTNPGEIKYGYDAESESEWKLRFSSYLKKLSKGTKESIQEGAKTAVIRDSRGYVTESVTSALVSETTNNLVDLYIHNGTGDSVSAALLAECEKVISGRIDGTTGTIYPGYKSAGIPVSIKPAQFTLLNFDVQLTLFSGWSVNTISATVQGNINKYINSLDIGDGFDLPQVTASYTDVYDLSETNQYKVVLIDSMGIKSVASSTLTTGARPVKITWTYPPSDTGPVVVAAEILKWSSAANAWQLLASYYTSGDLATDYAWYKPERTNTSLYLKNLVISGTSVSAPGFFDQAPNYRVGDRIQVIQQGGSGAVFTVRSVMTINGLSTVAGTEGDLPAYTSGSPSNASIYINNPETDAGSGYSQGAAITKLSPTYLDTHTKQKLYGIENGYPYYWDPKPAYQIQQDFVPSLARYVNRNGVILVPEPYSFYNDGRKFFDKSALIKAIMKTPGVAAATVVVTDQNGTAYDVFVPNKGLVVRVNTITVR
jgi:hypothetical protein